MLKAITNVMGKPVLKSVSWRVFWFVALFSFTINLLMLVVPLYSLQVFDRVLTSRSKDTLILMTIGVIFALFIMALIDLIRNHVLIRVGNNIEQKLNPLMLESSVNLASVTGKVTTQAMRDVTQFKTFMSGSFGLITLLDAPWIPVFFLVVWMIHPWLASTMIIFVVLLIIVNVLNELSTGKKIQEASEISMAANQRAEEIMRNADVVRAMGMKNSVMKYWFQSSGEGAAIVSNASEAAGKFASIAKFIRMAQGISMTCVGAYLAISNEITVGAMIASNILSGRGIQPLEGLINSWKHLVQTKTAVNRLNELYENFSFKESNTMLPVPKGDLVLEKVIFAPEGAMHPTIKGISFELSHGEILGVLGPSGAGKSTMSKLIAGIWKPRSGHVRLDGADVFTVWNRENFGQYVGYLPQEISLFAGTVKENIARFQEASDEEIIEAAIEANAHEMILNLPQGYDTQVGERGALLSGGQRQRIGLARALFRKPRLIILDEPNSFLDHEGDIALVKSIMKAKARGAAIIVITHKPAIVNNADKIAVLVAGQLQMYGEAKEVIKKLQPGGQQSNQPKQQITTEVNGEQNGI